MNVIVKKIYKFIQIIFPSLHLGVMWRVYARRRVAKKSYKLNLKRLKQQHTPYRVLFLATDASRWKLDSLYRLMIDNPNFEPMIMVTPIVHRGKEHMLSKMDECYEVCRNAYHQNVYKAFDSTTNTYLDANKFHPDIVFFTIPYPGMNDEQYYIDKFPNSLLCYTNYFYVDTNEKWFYDHIFHEILFRYYVENNTLKKIIKKFAFYRPSNCKVVGYPLFDTFREHEKGVSKMDKCIVIWAPHHSIEEGRIHKLSTFLQYAEFMQKIAELYKDKIHFVFKPHPELQNQLYSHTDWGKEKTDKYFAWWKNGENTSFVTGEYVDLFLKSSAMIHDCGSFLIEYLYTENPVMFLDAGNHETMINDVAKEARKCHYIGTSSEDIQQFIDKIVIGSDDPLKNNRLDFKKKYIIPSSGKLAAENIIDDLLESLGRR